jgi:hypothetical protein
MLPSFISYLYLSIDDANIHPSSLVLCSPRMMLRHASAFGMHICDNSEVLACSFAHLSHLPFSSSIHLYPYIHLRTLGRRGDPLQRVFAASVPQRRLQRRPHHLFSHGRGRQQALSQWRHTCESEPTFG